MEKNCAKANEDFRHQGAPRAPLSDEAVDSIASWLRVIAEPTRLRLLEKLNGGGASIQELATQLHTTRQNVSRHLNVLHQAGLISRRRVKNRVEHELVDFSGWWLIEQVGIGITDRLEERTRELRNCALS